MDIHELLNQADWRLRAYFGSPSTDARLVGWRRDPGACPVAEWLYFEELRSKGFLPDAAIVVDTEWIILRDKMIATPPVLSRFIDLIDRRQGAIFCGEGTRVDRAEAQSALLQAEHQVAQRLLPERATSVERCGYHDAGGGCIKRAISPLIYGFLDMDPHPHSKPQRGSCRPFLGRLCEEHWQQAVVPPDSWWPEELRGSREVVPQTELEAIS